MAAAATNSNTNSCCRIHNSCTNHP